MPIRRLDPLTIDRIAAGEVIERPAAAIKELVENALDARAKSVEVTIEAGGRRLIRVVDDGHGLDEGDLALAVERHATSKLPDGDLLQIATFGFRGEALPSIASVSRLEIRTRSVGAPMGLKLRVEDGLKSEIEPCASPFGARVEARDLFAATPARLKFLKSDRAEALAAADAVKRLAMAAPGSRAFRSRPIWAQVSTGRPQARATRVSQSASARHWATISPRIRSRSTRGATARVSSAGWACRPIADRTPPSSSCSSTGARCAIRRSPARCAAPISISCLPTGMRLRPCSSNALPTRSTSTSTLRRPKCAFATRPLSGA